MRDEFQGAQEEQAARSAKGRSRTNPGSTRGRVRRWGVAAALVLVAAALGVIVPNMLRTESESWGEVTHGATLTYCVE